jgi:hypothetical protein
MLIASPVKASNQVLPNTFKGHKGRYQFQCRITKAKATELGAEPFVDTEDKDGFVYFHPNLALQVIWSPVIPLQI